MLIAQFFLHRELLNFLYRAICSMVILKGKFFVAYLCNRQASVCIGYLCFLHLINVLIIYLSVCLLDIFLTSTMFQHACESYLEFLN